MGKRKQTPPQAEPPRANPQRTARAMLSAARQVAERIAARVVLLYIDGLDDLAPAERLIRRGFRLILVARNAEQRERAQSLKAHVLTVPAVRLSRLEQVKMAILFALGQGLLEAGETFVGLVGLAGNPIDSLIVTCPGLEWELFQSMSNPTIGRDIDPAVFQRVLYLAITLAAQGREGKPVGMLIVLGDTDKVLRYADQMILNPFQGYSPANRDILDDSLIETVREFAILDGAFLIRGNGEIASAGVYLRPTVPGEPLPRGLGARHATAAGITATTSCLAVTISESNATVRLWGGGRILSEIKRADGFLSRPGQPEPPEPPEDDS